MTCRPIGSDAVTRKGPDGSARAVFAPLRKGSAAVTVRVLNGDGAARQTGDVLRALGVPHGLALVVCDRLLFDSGAIDDLLEARRQVGPDRAQARRLVVEDLVDQARVRRPGEGQAPGEQVVEHDPEGVDVGLVGERLLLQLLRRHEGGRPDVDEIGAGCVGEHRDPEIGDFDLEIRGDQDVGGLDVAMDDAVPVHVLQGAADLEDHLDHFIGRQKVLRRRVVCERLPADVLHHDVAQRLLDRHVEQLDDVGVAELADQRGLVQEERAVAPLQSRGAGLRERLDGDVAPGEGIFREIDDARGAEAQLLDDVVFADALRKGFRHALLPAGRAPFMRCRRLTPTPASLSHPAVAPASGLQSGSRIVNRQS